MILSVDELKKVDDFSALSVDALSSKLAAIESLIRSYTNNNFQNVVMRISCATAGGEIVGSCPYFSVGDTLQISKSGVNDGLYVITGITDNKITVTGDHTLYDNAVNLVTKVEYPQAVKQGVVNLMIWERDNRPKVGIQSETISRHSVTYFTQDSNNTVAGYPVSLLGFLKPYVKARF